MSIVAWLVGHHIEPSRRSGIRTAAKQREALVKQGCQTNGLLPAVAQHLNVGAVTILVQNQIIHDKHLINIVFPAHASAEFQRRFIRQSLQLLVGIQGNLRFALCLKILRSAEIYFMRLAVYGHVCMKQLVR